MATYQISVTWDTKINNLYKDITLIQQGISAKLNISLRNISRITVNYKVGNEYFTDLCTIDLKNNKVVIPFKPSVIEVGTHQLELVCHMKNGDVLPTPTYSYTVTKSLTNDNPVEEHDNYPVLIELIQSITEKELIVEQAEAVREANELHRLNNEDERTNAEAERKANENTRISNEDIRQLNESNRQWNEDEREQYEATRRTNENNRINNEATRENAELLRLGEENERLRKEIERQNNESIRQEFYEGFSERLVHIESTIDRVSVKEFGAKGDGITDDTEAIKNALLENSNLYFPNGTYIISESITLSKSTNIMGEGQTLNWGVTDGAILKGTHDDYIFKCSWGNQNNFYKINFDGKGIYTPCSSFIVECGFTGDTGIYHSRVTTIDRCIFRGCSNAGIYRMVDSKILNSFFYSNEIGIYGYNSNDNIIQGNKIEWNDVGIKFDTNVYNLVQGNIFDRQTTYGIETVNGSYLSIKNNQFERNLINHIKLNNSNCNIIGNSFYHKQINDDGTGDLLPTDALFINSVNNCLIEGNTVVGTKMFSTAYSSVSGLITVNNTINGSSDDPKWVQIGTITVESGQTSELRYNWNSLSFLNANGYDVYVRGWRASDGTNTYYNNLSMYTHPNNGLFVDVTNSTSTSKDYTVYVLLEHKQWNKR